MINIWDHPSPQNHLPSHLTIFNHEHRNEKAQGRFWSNWAWWTLMEILARNYQNTKELEYIIWKKEWNFWFSTLYQLTKPHFIPMWRLIQVNNWYSLSLINFWDSVGEAVFLKSPLFPCKQNPSFYHPEAPNSPLFPLLLLIGFMHNHFLHTTN